MGHTTTGLALTAVLLIGGAAACSDGDEGGGTRAEATVPASPEDVSHEATPAEHTPRRLEEGQTITVTTDDGPAEVTLLAVDRRTAVGDTRADAGKQYVIYSMRVKNVGTTGEWDTSWLGSPRWSGSDGEADSPVFVVGPEDPRLIPFDPFSSTPEPRPGEHIRATEVLGVPHSSGTLQFEDASGSAQFDITVE
ncbi:hypothetical protein [Streptomyces sp. NPDC057412]|uniref:hypothetical protein n=1 Tax=Streptomyces sp. NPDC057412 TaxID=3346123 RepID=UPI0036CA70B3